MAAANHLNRHLATETNRTRNMDAKLDEQFSRNTPPFASSCTAIIYIQKKTKKNKKKQKKIFFKSSNQI